jgi:nucleoside-diphosphate-sugar epimerase
VARAYIVGCGCRGSTLGRRLHQAGWQVRGTTRDPLNSDQILEAGLEAVVADPDRVGTVLDHVGDVTILFWLLASAVGDPKPVAALHGARLERLLEELVDTPVRGVVYEAAGSVPDDQLEGGAAIVSAASKRWRIPSEVVRADPDDWEGWVEEMLAATERLIGGSGAE